MKISHALSVTFFLGLLTFGVRAEEYKAPKIKWQQNRVIPSPQVAQEKEINEFGENSWRIQEDPIKERNVASEEEPEGRNPSSEYPKLEEGPQLPNAYQDFKPIPSPRFWKYQP